MQVFKAKLVSTVDAEPDSDDGSEAVYMGKDIPLRLGQLANRTSFGEVLPVVSAEFDGTEEAPAVHPVPDAEEWAFEASSKTPTLQAQGTNSVTIQWQPTHTRSASSRPDVNNGRIESIGCVEKSTYGQPKTFGVTHITPGDPSLTTEQVLARHVEKLQNTEQPTTIPR